MHCLRCLHANAHMWTLRVVKAYYSIQNGFALVPCGYFHLVQPLDLQYAVGAVGNGVLKWVAALRHANLNPMFLQFCHILVATVLTASVRVMYKTSGSYIIYTINCHLQSL